MCGRVRMLHQATPMLQAVEVATIVGIAFAVHAQSSHKPLVPVAPAELLRYLPGAPADWKMTESSAKSFFLGWVCAQATREFQHPAPAPTQPGAAPPPPYVTRVR